MKKLFYAIAAVVVAGGMVAVGQAEREYSFRGVDESRIGDCFALAIEGADAEHPVPDDDPIYGQLTEEKCEQLNKCVADGDLSDCPRLFE